MIGCGYNPLFFQSKDTLAIPREVSFIEIGLEHLFLVDKIQSKGLEISLHVARSPITSHASIQNEYIKKLKALLEPHKKKIKSMGWHLTGPRAQGMGKFGFSTHYLPSKEQEQRAIDFIKRLQDEFETEIWLENANYYSPNVKMLLSAYDSFNRIVEATEIFSIVDLSHFIIDLHNCDFPVETLLGMIDFDKVVEFHLSGIVEGHDKTWHDGHSEVVHEKVWETLKLIKREQLANKENIMTIEHTDPSWKKKEALYYRDFQALQNLFKEVSTAPPTATSSSKAIGYSKSYLKKMIKKSHPRLVPVFKAQNLDLDLILNEWLEAHEKSCDFLCLNKVESSVYPIKSNALDVTKSLNQFMRWKYASQGC